MRRSVRVRVAGDRSNIDLYDLMFAFGRNLLFFQKIEAYLALIEAQNRFFREGEGQIDSIVDDTFMAFPLGRKIKTIKQSTKDEFYDPSAWRQIIEARNLLAHSFFATNARALHHKQTQKDLICELDKSLQEIILPRLLLLNDRQDAYKNEQNSSTQASFWQENGSGNERTMYNVQLTDISDILTLTAICQFEAERIETYLTALKDIQDFVTAITPTRNSTLGKAIHALEAVIGEENKADTPGKMIRDLRNHLSHSYLIVAPERYNSVSGREQCINELCLWLEDRFRVYVGLLPDVVQKVRGIFDEQLTPEIINSIEQNQAWLKDRLEVQIV